MARTVVMECAVIVAARKMGMPCVVPVQHAAKRRIRAIAIVGVNVFGKQDQPHGRVVFDTCVSFCRRL